MSLIGSQFGNLPGIGEPITTFENAVTWGPWAPRYWKSAYIASTASDPTNTPTWELRPGLVMAKITASGQWVNYSPTATDGSQIALGVLAQGLRLQDVFSGSNTAKFYAILASGGVKAAALFGLDNQARAQMSNRFIFDDNLTGNGFLEWLTETAKTANYQVLSTDNGTLFTNAGAGGAVTFTLPAIANGYKFGFRVVADQTVTVASTEGNNIVTLNDAAASSLAFSTGSQKIGGGLILESNAAGTLWYARNMSAGTNTITVV